MTISAHWQTQIEKWETSELILVIFCARFITLNVRTDDMSGSYSIFHFR
jgi:hypothetical protein